MDRIDHCLYSISSGLILFPVRSVLYFSPVPHRGLQSRAVVDYYLSCFVRNGAKRIEHDHPSRNVCLKLTCKSRPWLRLSRYSGALDYRRALLWWYVWLNEHLAELFQLLRATDLLCEQRELDDMEEFVV